MDPTWISTIGCIAHPAHCAQVLGHDEGGAGWVEAVAQGLAEEAWFVAAGDQQGSGWMFAGVCATMGSSQIIDIKHHYHFDVWIYFLDYFAGTWRQ